MVLHEVSIPLNNSTIQKSNKNVVSVGPTCEKHSSTIKKSSVSNIGFFICM